MKYFSLVSFVAVVSTSFGQIPDGFEPAFEGKEIENAKHVRVSDLDIVFAGDALFEVMNSFYSIVDPY